MTNRTTTEELTTITNEFGHVIIRQVETPKGERLELEAPKLGQAIRLDAVALESITWQSKDTFTNFITEDMNSELGPEQTETQADEE